MKLSFYSLSLLFGTSTADDGECKYALELLQIQDGSGSFEAHVETMKSTTVQLVQALSDTFGEFKYGISSFVDKPIPTRGFGFYGNYASMGTAADWCFEVHSGMTMDASTIKDGLTNLGSNMGGGGDFPENPYEALVFAAYNKKVGWSAPGVSHSDSGRPIARLALVITDDIPHYAPDAVNGANLAWNGARTYANPDYSAGGFGSRFWGDLPQFMFYGGSKDKAQYEEMSDLFKIVDLGGVLTTTQEARLDKLITKFGPYPFPTMIVHPGDDSLECDRTEYPTVTQVAAALNKFKITPVILAASPQAISKETDRHCRQVMGMEPNVDCLVATYKRDMEDAGVSAIVQSISSTDVIDNIITAIGAATEKICLTPSEAPTEAPEETEAPAKTEAPEETEDPEETEEPEITDAPEETEAPEETGPENTKPENTRPAETEPVETTTTTAGAGAGGPNIGLIAGAAGGAIAGVAAIVGAVYKTVGFGMFGGQAAGEVAVQQVETAENPVERETMEEVTMDMFQ